MFPPVGFEYCLNSQVNTVPYFLVDGIYPAWRIFANAIKHPTTENEKFYNQRQKSIRKDIERAFGALKKRFGMLQKPCRLQSEDAMYNIMYCCIIIHNMVIDSKDIHNNANMQTLHASSMIECDLNRNVRHDQFYCEETGLYSKVAYEKLRAELVTHCTTYTGEFLSDEDSSS